MNEPRKIDVTYAEGRWVAEVLRRAAGLRHIPAAYRHRPPGLAGSIADLRRQSIDDRRQC
jgi:hypothetical protein